MIEQPPIRDIETLKPQHDFILVEPIERSKVTQNGLHLPQNYDDRTRIGRVVAFGPGKWCEAGTRCKIDYLNEGDLILYAEHTWASVEVGGTKCVLMQENAVMGVIGGAD